MKYYGDIMKPAIPFKSIKHCAVSVMSKRFKIFNMSKFNFVDKFPCYECNGLGYLHEWTGIGSNYNDTDCNFCNMTGIVNLERFKKYYDNIMKDYRKRMIRYNRDERRYKKICGKISKSDLQFIKYYGDK